jgi:hypothetical protein
MHRHEFGAGVYRHFYRQSHNVQLVSTIETNGREAANERQPELALILG